jgi:triphosphoribosyl-dephospho-CoA synthase
MGAFGNSVRCTPVAPDLRAAQLGALAVASLIDEARLSPKPGLVDSRGSGAHIDLDLALMERSARSLEPAFAAMARAGSSFGAPTIELRETLGRLGREAEVTLAATGGVTTIAVRSGRWACWWRPPRSTVAIPALRGRR